MLCIKCSCEEFVVKEDAIFEQIFKGKTLMVKSPGMVCKECGWLTVGSDNGQFDILLKKVKELYIKSYGNQC